MTEIIILWAILTIVMFWKAATRIGLAMWGMSAVSTILYILDMMSTDIYLYSCIGMVIVIVIALLGDA